MDDANISISTAEAAKMIGVKPHTLAEWRRLKRGPDYIRIGPTNVRYNKKQVQDWLAARTVKVEG